MKPRPTLSKAHCVLAAMLPEVFCLGTLAGAFALGVDEQVGVVSAAYALTHRRGFLTESQVERLVGLVRIGDLDRLGDEARAFAFIDAQKKVRRVRKAKDKAS